jgi:hypothetical protein
MEGQGWVKLHRTLLYKPIWLQSTPEQKTILITLILMANHNNNQWEWEGKKFTVRPGQFITSLNSIVKKCGKGISIQNVRSAIKRFVKLEFLTNESTKTGSLITIVNWGNYQEENTDGNKDTGKEVTKRQQRRIKEVTTNKNDKNDKNDKNIYSQQTEQLWSLYPRKIGKKESINIIAELIQKHGFDNMERAINRYKQEIETNGTEVKFIKQGNTFFNIGYFDYLDENYTEGLVGEAAPQNPWENMSS